MNDSCGPQVGQHSTIQYKALLARSLLTPHCQHPRCPTPTADAEEREKLERQFGLERARASERIMRITEEHEMALATRMAQLGVLRD